MSWRKRNPSYWVEVETSPGKWLGVTMAASASWAIADAQRRDSERKRFRAVEVESRTTAVLWPEDRA